MAIWYIDSVNGNDAADGKDEMSALRSVPLEGIHPGDCVLLKCGSVFHGALLSPNGEVGKPIRWSSYGEGLPPVFLGSEKADQESDWIEVAEHIWKWNVSVEDEVGNIIFDDGDSFGTLRWNFKELEEEGDWFFTHYGSRGKILEGEQVGLYLYSTRNPGKMYHQIDIAMYGARCLVKAEHDVIIENIIFKNGGVHGFAASNTARICILNCRFENIGGCVWNSERKIRYGNGIELWEAAEDIRIENCSFHQIYDSCFTPQGAGKYSIPQNLICRNCLCEYYGMAALEVREVMPVNLVFENNACHYAGVGFAMQGEELPRKSEIWPQPMGHHVFIWNIKRSVEEGNIFIKNNFFGSVPCGSVVYSIVDEHEQNQVHYEGNRYIIEYPERAMFLTDRYVKDRVGITMDKNHFVVK